MQVMEFPFQDNDALNDIDGDRQMQQTLNQKKSQQQIQQNPCSQ